MQRTPILELKDAPNTESKIAAVPISIKEISEDGTFEGYGSTFGNEDQGGDVVMAGAFRRTIKEKKRSSIKLLRDHDPRKIVGKWLDLREDERGLYCKGQLFAREQDHNPLAKETLALMREGALDAMSIGYRTIEASYDERTSVRKLIDVDLWEISVVTFPMNVMATVDAVKADDLTIRDVERILREGGAPAEFAKQVAIHGYDGALTRLGSRREGGAGGKSIAEMIRETTAQLKGN